MGFAVIPALDLWRGRLAVFEGDRPRPIDVFGGDPVAAADAFAAAGAGRIHVVDMDLAFGGEPGNLDVVRRLAASSAVRVQAAGGIRTADEAAAYLEAGADRVVLGSAALADEDVVLGAIERWREAVLVGIEVVGGAIRSRGRDPISLDLMSTLGWVAASGVAGLVVTAVDRVGAAAGPDGPTVRRVARSGRPVLAAGGVRHADDLRALRDAGAVGAIVGRAALEGRLDLADAIAQGTGP